MLAGIAFVMLNRRRTIPDSVATRIAIDCERVTIRATTTILPHVAGIRAEGSLFNSVGPTSPSNVRY